MNQSTTHDIASALQGVQDDIQRFEQQYGRKPGSVRLLAVSKRKPVADIRSAMAAGQQVFGENYVDEALQKMDALDGHPLEWHFIGAIQSRKTVSIARFFDWAHGVDRIKVARRLSTQRPVGMPPLSVCLQVNTDAEEGKAGIAFDDVARLADACATLEGIRLRGLMAIPAPRSRFDEQRRVFARMRKCLQGLQGEHPTLDTLSMGMSGDMEAAIAEGATLVRIGTTIFGRRDP